MVIALIIAEFVLQVGHSPNEGHIAVLVMVIVGRFPGARQAVLVGIMARAWLGQYL
jgi:hypothetical protein